MAYESINSDTVVRLPVITLYNGCKVIVQLAYRLYADQSNPDDLKVRCEITYIHARLDTSSYKSPTDGFDTTKNGRAYGVVVPMIGNTDKLFDEAKYNDKSNYSDGHYDVSKYGWPYLSSALIGQTATSNPQNEVRKVNSYIWGGLPLFSFVVKNFLASTDISSTSFEYYKDADRKYTTVPNIIAYGLVFSDVSKFSGTNLNNQRKIKQSTHYIDICSSSVTVNGTRLSYDDDIKADVTKIKIDNPYSVNQCLVSFEFTQSELNTYGLLKYSDTDFATDGVYDPYYLKAFVAAMCTWNVCFTSNKAITYKRQDVQEIKIQSTEIYVPEYPNPEPIKPLTDDKVYILKSSKWVKCQRIGQE